MKGLVFIFKKIGVIFGWLANFFVAHPNVFFGWVLGLFLFWTFLFNLFTQGFVFAITELAHSVLGAEHVIHENVTLAINNAPEYGVFEFVEIWMSFMIIWFLVKKIAELIHGFSGAQAPYGAIFIAIVIVAIIEFSAVTIINWEFSFVPIKDGIIYLIFNLQPVFSNIHFF